MLKKYFITLLLATAGLFIAVPVFAAEQINLFDADIHVRPDSNIKVVERIEYDFGTEQRHGIFRNIPISYNARGGKFNLRISDVTVTDAEGSEYQFEQGHRSGELFLKIGDPDRFVTGVKTYVISYTVGRAINYFDRGDELYWNVTGNQWEVPINQSHTEVYLPKVLSEDVSVACFSGYEGSSEACSDYEKVSAAGKLDKITFSTNTLTPGQGLTAVVGFPKGVVVEPGWLTKLWNTIRDNWILVLPILVFGFMYYLWSKTGRDPKGREVVIARYEAPQGFSPLELGALIDENVEPKDISAEIIHLAVLGYLKVKQTEKGKLFKSKDYELIKTKDESVELEDHQKMLFKALFKKQDRVKLSKLKNKFYKDYRKISKHVYQTMVDENLFKNNPQKTRRAYLTGAGVIIFLSFWSGGVFGFLAGIALAISGLIIGVFGWLMPARTARGVEMQEHALGLKKYLEVAEKGRIKFHNAPEKKPELFEKFLPFAMAFGVEEDWAKQFKDIYRGQPEWYEGQSGTFNTVVLASSLSDFSSQAGSALTSSPGSSASSGSSGFSGGFSGGGFGGGGGGSW